MLIFEIERMHEYRFPYDWKECNGQFHEARQFKHKIEALEYLSLNGI